ncbi:MAG: hypothetical protein FWE98_01165 [Oscillospiraceae bacterium]|nr:hypothetical protein [Oscillospiraceae bacterium]
MYIPNEHNHALMEEARRLLREITEGRMSWKKIGKMIRFNALVRTRERCS